MPTSDAIFDASKYQDHEKVRKQNVLVWNMIFFSSILIWPIMIALIYFILPEEEFSAGISKSTLIIIFAVIWIVDIIAMAWLKKKFAGRLKNPVRITSQGIELSENSVVLASEITKIRIDTEGSVGLYKAGKGFPIRILSKGELGNSEEFVRIIKEQNPLIETENMNEMIKKYQAERKAKKEARKGL